MVGNAVKAASGDSVCVMACCIRRPRWNLGDRAGARFNSLLHFGSCRRAAWAQPGTREGACGPRLLRRGRGFVDAPEGVEN